MKTRVLTFKADESLIRILEEMTARTGRSRSEIIRMAIMRYYREIEVDDSSPKSVQFKRIVIF